MPKPDKKQRHKKRRQAKRLATRKLNSISPIKRLATANGIVQCWSSGDFGHFGQIQIFIHKQAAGLSGVACFLIDRGVVGLKDAWFQMGVTAADLQEKLDISKQREIEMRKTTIEDARKWIAAGVRWAHDNHMRLPAEWIKCASLIGGVGDWQSADVSAFAMEFMGHPEDLRQRLIGQPFDEFIQRSDLTFVFSNEAPYEGQSADNFFEDEDEFSDEPIDAFDDATQLLDHELDELDKKFAENIELLTQSTLAWLRLRNETASTELHYAWECIYTANALAKLTAGERPQAEVHQQRDELITGMSQRLESRSRSEFSRGVTQVMQHLAEDPDLIAFSPISPEFIDQQTERSIIQDSNAG